MDVEHKPVAQALQTFALLRQHGTANASRESLVNGIWGRVLGRLFPAPKYIIAPEHWTDRRRPGGSRVDFVVWDTQNQRPVFVYEGKGGTEKLTFRDSADGLDDILAGGLKANLEQIQRYLATLTRTSGETSYGMLAQGTQFIFMSYDGIQYHRIREASLATDENFTNFRDFVGERFSLDTAEEILENIAMKYN